jgi:hypothetical protein
MKKIKMIIALALCLVMVLGISATAFAQDPQIPLGTSGKITGDVVNLRSTPAGDILGNVLYGEKCWYQGYGGYANAHDWHKVLMGSGSWNGHIGYVASSLVYWYI